MKRIAILVIASTSSPLYVHYIRTYWSALIHHTRVHRPHIDVFLDNHAIGTVRHHCTSHDTYAFIGSALALKR